VQTRVEKSRRVRVSSHRHTVHRARAGGAHPDALAAIFSSGTPTDPEDLGDAPEGTLLAIPATVSMHLLLRPIVRALSRGPLMLWQGLAFDHGGNAGKNRFLGRDLLRFRAERATSLLDQQPALVLSYERAPWPTSKLRDELRTIAPGLAMGPTFLGDTIPIAISILAVSAPCQKQMGPQFRPGTPGPGACGSLTH
jgi:hypothetical protein